MQPIKTMLMAATAVALFWNAPAFAQPRGETLLDMLEAARQLNPEAAAMELEADAADARAEAAGWLDDPKIQIETELMRDRPGIGPSGDQALVTYRIVQMVPWWDKLSLKREAAEALARSARARQQVAANEVVYRVKEAYAQYHLAHMATEELTAVLRLLDGMSKQMQARYAQGLGRQQEVTGIEAERAAMRADIAKMQADRRRAKVRLNGLMARAATAPLTEEPQQRPIPALEMLPVDMLVERALAANPLLREQFGQIEAADRNQALADREWYPDFEASFGVMQRERDVEGYEIMVGFNIPLQVPKRRAMQREASAMASAARTKLEQVRLEITTMVHQAHAELDALRQRKRFLRETTIPQARISVEAAANAYQLSRQEFPLVLVAAQTLRRAVLDWLNVQYEEQIRLAEMERLVGGEL